MIDHERNIETVGPSLAKLIMGWDTPMWRRVRPWGPWTQGEPPSEDDNRKD